MDSNNNNKHSSMHINDIRDTTVIEALPALKSIAKAYSLKLNRLSDFKIARAIWANACRQIPGL
jgi:expansin (peptidoglycan-binding protein)